MAMNIISRAQWGARAARSVTTTTWSRRIGVAFHYSEGNPNDSPRDLQNYAMDSLGYVDTHYNFFVNRDGTAYEGRGWMVVAAHAKDQNTPWIGVCFIGRNADVTQAALNTMRDFYDEACRLSGRTLQFSGHGQLPGQNTDCPGATIKAWIAAGMPRGEGDGDMELIKNIQQGLKDAGFDPGTVDGQWGPKTQAAFVAALRASGAGSQGPQGPAGPKGDAGEPGRAPTRVVLELEGKVVSWE